MPKSEEEVEQKPEAFELVEVPTSMGIAIKSPEGEILSTEQAIVMLLNEMREIKEAVA